MTLRNALAPSGIRFSLHRILAGLILLTAFAAAPMAQTAGAANAADQPVVHQLLDAMAANDYQRFISYGTPAFAEVDESQFAQVAGAVAPRLRQGYDVEYLGRLRQQGLDISVWKISFPDQGDDLLATLNIANGRVGGFFLR